MQHQHLPSEQSRFKPVESFTFIHAGILDTGWHQHSEHQLIYAEEGVLHVLSNNFQFLLPAYHGVWIPARSAHKLVSPSKKTKLWLLYFQPIEEESIILQNVHIFGISLLAREMLLHTERWSEEETNIRDASPLAKNFYEAIRLLAVEWCAEPLKLILPYTEDVFLGNVTRYMLDIVADPLNIANVAQVHGVSGRTLMRLFRSQLGMTFGSYLRTARIVKAVELLTAPSVSILEVAYDVGYKSPSSFSQAFRRLTSMSPQEYTKRIRL